MHCEGFAQMEEYTSFKAPPELSRILKYTFDSFELRVEQLRCPYGAKSKVTVLPTMQWCILQSAPHFDSLDSLERIPAYVMEACKLAARIWFRAVSLLISFQGPANKNDMRSLSSIMHLIGLRPWTGIPYIHQWMYVLRP